MSDIRKMSNVSVAMQSALAAAKTITGITLAAPGVVSSTAHGYSNGDYVLLEVQGMSQVNERVFRVCNQATDSFQLDDVSGGTGIDTTDYDTFSSGTAKKITFGTSITTMSNAQMAGGEYEKLDTSVIHAKKKTSIPGVAEAFDMEFEHNWDITDAGQAALKAASDAQEKKAFKFTFGTGGRIVLFYGYVGHSALPNASGFGQVIKTKSTITAENDPTYYSA
jgi:hypothetical protein